MGYRVHTFSPDSDTPTGQVADLEIAASYDDLGKVAQFARNVSAVTFEFENVPAAMAAAAAQQRPGCDQAAMFCISLKIDCAKKRFFRRTDFPRLPSGP